MANEKKTADVAKQRKLGQRKSLKQIQSISLNLLVATKTVRTKLGTLMVLAEAENGLKSVGGRGLLSRWSRKPKRVFDPHACEIVIGKGKDKLVIGFEDLPPKGVSK